MEMVIGLVAQLIPLAFLCALISVPVFYSRYRRVVTPKQELPVLRYVAIVFGFAAVAYFAGAMLGIFAACSFAAAGNLCGLFGVFGVGPLAAAASLFFTARYLTQRARRAP